MRTSKAKAKDIGRRTLLAACAAVACVLGAGSPLQVCAQGVAKTLNIAVFPEPNTLLAGAASTGPALMVSGNIYD